MSSPAARPGHEEKEKAGITITTAKAGLAARSRRLAPPGVKAPRSPPSPRRATATAKAAAGSRQALDRRRRSRGGRERRRYAPGCWRSSATRPARWARRRRGERKHRIARGPPQPEHRRSQHRTGHSQENAQVSNPPPEGRSMGGRDQHKRRHRAKNPEVLDRRREPSSERRDDEPGSTRGGVGTEPLRREDRDGGGERDDQIDIERRRLVDEKRRPGDRRDREPTAPGDLSFSRRVPGAREQQEQRQKSHRLDEVRRLGPAEPPKRTRDRLGGLGEHRDAQVVQPTDLAVFAETRGDRQVIDRFVEGVRRVESQREDQGAEGNDCQAPKAPRSRSARERCRERCQPPVAPLAVA